MASKQARVLGGDVFTVDPSTGEPVILRRGTTPPPEYADFLAGKDHLWEDPNGPDAPWSDVGAGPRIVGE